MRSIIGARSAPFVIFVIFVLLEREDLRDRFIKLAGAGDLQKSTQAINDVPTRAGGVARVARSEYLARR